VEYNGSDEKKDGRREEVKKSFFTELSSKLPRWLYEFDLPHRLIRRAARVFDKDSRV
jgi:hypothetical protein